MANRKLDLEADVQPVTDFRSNSARMLEQVRETGRPIVLTQRGRSAAVVLDVRTYQDLLDELDELRDIARGVADADAGQTMDSKEARSRILADLK